MQLSPKQREILDKLGVNTTRLQWRLYQWEKRKQSGAGWQLPTALRWLSYPHKRCPKCRALVNRDVSVCPQCNSRVYSMAVYRVMRFLGILAPEGATPVITVFLLLMVALFGGGLILDGPAGLLRPSGRTLMALGGWSHAAVLTNLEYWRELSFGLIHIGVIHILFNLAALVQLGPVIESSVGSRRMLVVITATQLTAAIASHVWYGGVLSAPFVKSAGASGWLFGLIGFGIAHFHRSGGAGRAYTSFLVQWAVYGIAFGLIMHANNAGHIGGVLGGLLLGTLPDPNPARKTLAEPVWNTAYWLCLSAWCATLGFMAHSVYLTVTMSFAAR